MEWLSRRATTKYTRTLQPREKIMAKKHNVGLLNMSGMEKSWTFMDNVVMYYRKQRSTAHYDAVFPNLVHIRCLLKL